MPQEASLPDIFDFNIKRKPPKWLVKNLIPLGKLLFNFAQSGIGKSYWVEALAANVVYSELFLGEETLSGDVLIVDEDTPTDTLEDRLAKFGQYFDHPPVHNLYWRSMEGLRLRGGSLIKAIMEYEDTILVIIDCLTSVCGGLDLDKGRDMTFLGDLKNTCINPNRTIIINHHISEKKQLPVDTLMVCDPHSLSMYSSVINQQADGYYIIGSPDIDGVLRKLFVRPISKRITIKTPPFTCHLVETANHLSLNSLEPYSTEGILALPEEQSDILTLFRESPFPKGVREMDTELKGKYGLTSIRKASAELEKLKLLHLSRGKSNLFMYSLPVESPSINREET